jgi:hypothetical protein
MGSANQIPMLERALADLIKEWEKYFAGVRQTPPVEERERLQRRLRMLTEQPPTSRPEQYRLEQVQHRFMSYAQMWERMLREREEGRGRSAAALREARRIGGAPPPRPDARPAASVDAGEKDDLFDRWVAAKAELGQKVKVDRAAFAAQIAGQRQAIEERLGGNVRFDVVVDGDKVKLAARKVRPGSKQE